MTTVPIHVGEVRGRGHNPDDAGYNYFIPLLRANPGNKKKEAQG